MVARIATVTRASACPLRTSSFSRLQPQPRRVERRPIQPRAQAFNMAENEAPADLIPRTVRFSAVC